MPFRHVAAMESLRKIDTLIVGKTGTLTEGRPAFERAMANAGFDDKAVLRLPASLDQKHPQAAAIVAAAREQGRSHSSSIPNPGSPCPTRSRPRRSTP